MISKKLCRTCKYRVMLNGEIACNYLDIKKERRGCNEGMCTRYEKGKQIIIKRYN